MIRSRYRPVYLLLLLTIMVAGCRAKPGVQKSQGALPALTGQRIAVMPFIRGLPDLKIDQPMKRLLYCRLADLCFNIKELRGNADELMTDHLQDVLEKRYGGAVNPLQIVQSVYAGLPKNPFNDTAQALAVALGRKLKADYIMVGTVWRYKERVGSATGSPSPASVAFALYLLDVKKEAPVWEASFDKTQQALSENILNIREFFSMGRRWLTADELARYGLKQVLDETP